MKFGSGKRSMESSLNQDWPAAIRRTSVLVCGTLFLGSAQIALAAPDDRPSMREFRDMHTDLSRREARDLFKDTYNARSAVGASLPTKPEIKQARLEAMILRHNALATDMNNINRGLEGKLQRLGVQQIGSSIVRLNSGVDLDLTSGDRNIVLGSNLFKNTATSIDINVGGASQTFTAGSKVTAGEYIAVKQALSGAGQKLLLDANGIANGGTLDFSEITAANDPMRAANLTVSSGVTTYGDFGKSSDFILKGDLNNYGSIYAMSSRSSARGGAIRADDITNQSGALISSVSNNPSNSYSPKLDLELNARGELVNHGTIESSGNLKLVSGMVPVLASSSPTTSSITNTGMVSAQDSASLIASDINNSGTISAVNGNINIDGSAVKDINVDNTNGTLSALNGAINVRTPQYQGTFNNNISGGDLLSKQVNLYAGTGGTNNVYVNELTGVLAQAGLAGHVMADTSNLIIGETCLTGDPTFYNHSDITIAANVSVGETLAIISKGNIFVNPGVTIEARDQSQGFDITMIAGANITNPASGSNFPPAGAGASVTFDGPSATGGTIKFETSSILTSPTGTNGNGGHVSLFAFKGSNSTSGWVDANSVAISTGGRGTGTNGNVTIVAGGANPLPAQVGFWGSTAIQIGAIDTTGGTGGGGNLSVTTAQPTIVGDTTVTYNANGTLAGPGNLAASPTLTAGASIGQLGGIARIDNDVTMAAGKDILQNADAPLYTNGIFADVVLTAQTGRVGADPVNAFIINGFDKIFTKSVLKKNNPGDTTLTVNAGDQAFIIRYASTNLTLLGSSATNGLQIQTRSNMNVEGNVASSNGFIRLQNTGGSFETASGITMTAMDFIDLTNASKSNLKSTFTAGTNTTYTTAGGVLGAGDISMSIDQKAFRLDLPKNKSIGFASARRSVPPPTLSSNDPGSIILTGTFPGLTVNVVGSGEARQFGKRDLTFNLPMNTINVDDASVNLTNNAKDGAMVFNGNVSINASN
jgi:hypothetical protein